MNLFTKVFTIAIVLLFCLSANISEAKSGKKSSDPNMMHKLEVKSSDSGGTLLFSDSPEYVRENGILYSDVVEGDGRLLFYHLNESNVNKRIAVIVENLTNKPNTIFISRGVISEPSSNFLKVGKSVQSEYMQETFNYSLYLDENDKDLLIDDINKRLIKPGQLIYGVYDFNAAKKVRISVIMYPQDENPLEFIKKAKVLPKDKHQLRGTFNKMNRTINVNKTYDPDEDGIVYVMLADDVNDLFKMGIDATDGSKVKNFGNYGVNYTINIKTKKDKKARICLTPLGGYYAGAMKVHYNGETNLILTPMDRIFFGDKTPREPETVKKVREECLSLMTDTIELAELGTYSGKVTFEYSPPGASNLPVHLVLMPVADSENKN